MKEKTILLYPSNRLPEGESPRVDTQSEAAERHSQDIPFQLRSKSPAPPEVTPTNATEPHEKFHPRLLETKAPVSTGYPKSRTAFIASTRTGQKYSKIFIPGAQK